MPVMSQDGVKAPMRPLRLLLYGAAKTRKTLWACSAAQAGYNVILLDGDDGAHIVSQHSDAAKKRIGCLTLMDKADVQVFITFATGLLKGTRFFWDEEARQEIAKTSMKAGKQYAYINSSLLTRNDVLVIDSWTALCSSMLLEYSMQKGIKLEEAEKTTWDGYGWQGNLIAFLMQKMHALPCHVVVIGHATVYEKYAGGKEDRKLVDQRTQVISSSGNQSKRLAKEFSDVFYFSVLNEHTTLIDTASAKDRDGGSRIVKPGRYEYSHNASNPNDFNFGQYAKLAGLTPPSQTGIYDSAGVKFILYEPKPAEAQPVAEPGAAKTSA